MINETRKDLTKLNYFREPKTYSEVLPGDEETTPFANETYRNMRGSDGTGICPLISICCLIGGR